jgi:hypothetical protein
MGQAWMRRDRLESYKAVGEVSFHEEPERERGFEPPAACLEGISL